MLPEQIFQNKTGVLPEIHVEVIRHVDLGCRVICAYCKVNGIPAKRITQDIYGQPVNEVPVWSVQNRIVARWFAGVLEKKYLQSISGQDVIVYTN